uniref:Uncharacterized protein n=1 Tax=Glossina palpalis gambiensis TaxID=67801 RepID=A0A1B0BA43_9MUSC
MLSQLKRDIFQTFKSRLFSAVAIVVDETFTGDFCSLSFPCSVCVVRYSRVSCGNKAPRCSCSSVKFPTAGTKRMRTKEKQKKYQSQLKLEA